MFFICTAQIISYTLSSEKQKIEENEIDNYHEKLVALANKVQQERIAHLVANDLACEANRINAVTSIKVGKKYDKIDVGHSGTLMVVKTTGEVFGVKAYGVIHKGHAYGTLDTIDDWYWGLYYPVKLTGWIIKSDVDQSYVVSDTQCTYRIQEATVFMSKQVLELADEASQVIKVELDRDGKPLRRA